jgi:hypothetical protein
MKRFSRNLARIQVKGYLEILKLPYNNKKEKEGQWKYRGTIFDDLVKRQLPPHALVGGAEPRVHPFYNARSERTPLTSTKLPIESGSWGPILILRLPPSSNFSEHKTSCVHSETMSFPCPFLPHNLFGNLGILFFGRGKRNALPAESIDARIKIW